MNTVQVVICLILWIWRNVEATQVASFQRQQILDTILKDYDPRIPPSYDNGYPVYDIVQMYILSIDSISDSSMDFTMSFYLRQRWNDSRLVYNESLGIDVIELDSRIMDSIWTPDIYIINEKEARFHYVTMPNRMMYLYPDGNILYSARISGTFSCLLQLHKYPLDNQICDLRMESYSHSARSVYIRWHDQPVVQSPKLTLPQFSITETSSFICDTTYMEIQYTCVGMKIFLERDIGYYMIQIYVPSILIVTLSFVNFWLNVDAVPARITLGLLTVLTMTTQSVAAVASIQKVSYIKALDIWLQACLIFVFAALLEFACVNVSFRVETRRKSVADLPALIAQSTVDGKPQTNGHCKQNRNTNGSLNSIDNINGTSQITQQSREKARTIDRVSRVVFPLTFILFNIFYWIFYMIWEPVHV